MKTLPKIFLIFALCALAAALASCSFMPQAELVEGEEREQVTQTATPIAENLLQGLNDQDYPTFSRDFDETMKKALDQKSFDQMAATFDEKIGDYLSMEVEKVQRVEDLFVVSYKARYEKEEAVSIRLTIRPGEPTQVAGLWFDSPKLRAN